MSKRNGFTLLELLLATVLTAMLMVGVLGVITQVVRPVGEQAVAGGPGDAPIPDAVIALMYDDLKHARSIDTRRDEIELFGYGLIDPATGERLPRPSLVTYRLITIDERSWLLRSERAMDRGDAAATRHELISPGLSRFDLIAPPKRGDPVAPTGPSGSQDPLAAARVVAELDKPYPDEVWRLRLWAGDSREPTVDTPVVLRGGLTR